MAPAATGAALRPAGLVVALGGTALLTDELLRQQLAEAQRAQAYTGSGTTSGGSSGYDSGWSSPGDGGVVVRFLRRGFRFGVRQFVGAARRAAAGLVVRQRVEQCGVAVRAAAGAQLRQLSGPETRERRGCPGRSETVRGGGGGAEPA